MTTTPPDRRPQPPAAGGGGIAAHGGRETADLVRRAVRERWPIPDGTRALLPAVLGAILADDEADSRARVAAARALLEADKVNLEQEKRDAGIPDRLDVTTGGRPLESVSLTPADVALARALLGRTGGDLPADGRA